MNQVLENIKNLENILHKQKTVGDLHRPEFRHILDEIEVALDRQDSDIAL